MQTREQHRPMERDSQRRRVYTAEGNVGLWHTRTLDPDATKQRLLDVLNDARVRTAFPFLSAKGADKIEMSFSRRMYCRGGAGGLKFYSWGVQEQLFLHEMAHLIQQREQRADARTVVDPGLRDRKAYRQWHGWRFCAIYLQLVLWFMGREFHDALKRSFVEQRVKFRAPRNISPELRLALANRLRRMRGEPIRLAA